MKSLLRILSISLLMVSGLCCSSDAKKVTSKLSAPKEETQKKTTKNDKSGSSLQPDIVLTPDSAEFADIAKKVNFLAYDKKASSAKETFFVDNNSSDDIICLDIEISYYTNSGKLIHKREETLTEIFPSGESRKVDIASWDTQKSFHYHKSTPSKKGSTPYSVKIRVLRIGLIR